MIDWEKVSHRVESELRLRAKQRRLFFQQEDAFQQQRKSESPMPARPWYVSHYLAARDGFRCYLCCCDLTETGFHIEHRLARANGGGHDYDNLALACPHCNCSKNSQTIENFIIRKLATP